VFVLDENDPTPLYAQLERSIRLAIATGRLQPGDRLPTVRQLAVDLRINANTVARVYGELERSGLLATRRGVGTFIQPLGSQVANLPDRKRQLAILADRFLSEAAALGFSAPDAIATVTARWKNLKEEKSNGRGQ
jgi:GntR family transcriptional regulator